ncbi:MAG TPA: hypothetical protein VH087_02640 [Thermoanaerobaculia bacterium]|jgi:hypothetical protein|nr:hypothetical protein [Thermoanaerobaculia bacterium]
MLPMLFVQLALVTAEHAEQTKMRFFMTSSQPSKPPMNDSTAIVAAMPVPQAPRQPVDRMSCSARRSFAFPLGSGVCSGKWPRRVPADGAEGRFTSCSVDTVARELWRGSDQAAIDAVREWEDDRRARWITER